ncbi:sensor histidine kinase [Clostridium cochlearium]|uniref:histidine kinase n=1 Tax=Clostridium cochlearium TaxID=1494 RepID=A0A2X2WJK8_CLOCO|nr:HAMP domain-containing sensor histidine kinase [Clostridium cochlearium]MCR1971453.1 HAMP domain-containing histidine kinase [Clostridium cochlearium]SQB36145.1 sensor histidine kinase [Clostridium cochlearium]
MLNYTENVLPFMNIAHDIKTPLNIINSSIQLIELKLKEGKIIDEEFVLNEQIKILKNSSTKLIKIINDFINNTNIEDFNEINIEECNIVNVVEESTLYFADYLKNKNIQLIFDTSTEEKIIECDVDKIESVIFNLISNAIKFTPKYGKIQVNVYDKVDFVEIVVRDTGIGIPKDKIDKIFQRSIRLDNYCKEIEGSGIGLYIVKTIVDMHNGDIIVNSDIGKGSEFIIKIPAKNGEKENVT